MMHNFSRIPAELQQLNQWCLWRYEETSNGKPTKVPYQPDGIKHASVTDRATWHSFANCITAFNTGSFAGMGFIFSDSDPYAGIDLDASDDNNILERQAKIFAQFDSYAERSPSGNGLHIIIRASVISGRKRSSVELYSSNRFFTMTGDVYNDKPIANRQELAEILWQEMGKVKEQTFAGSFEEPHTDAQIIEQATNASNGAKFAALQAGNWKDMYPSQSEADMAYCDIVAFYTQSRNQISRLFRNSGLGQRDKAKRVDYVQYMLNKVFDRMLPPVDIEGLQNAWGEASAKHAAQSATAAPVELPPPSPYQQPPGLLGDIARFVYEASPRQVPEIALAAAVAFMSGLCGRAYNVSGTGLNQYVLLLAPTGTGKEAMASGIDKLVASIRDEVPAIKQFIGPGEIASGQALLKYLSKTSSSFVCVIGEFGLKLQQLSSMRANPAELMLKKVLLDLYNKSGNGKQLQPAIYSQKENNTEAINSPAVTLLGESTPETFYSTINESIIADGLLPRFMIVEYMGHRPRRNLNHLTAQPSEQLKERLATLTAHCLRLNAGTNGWPLAVNVQFTPEAEALLDKFDIFADNEINGSSSEIIKQLWNRAHIKALKLASLVAVGVHPYEPTIDMDQATWAINIVRQDIHTLQAKFAAGEIGKDESENKQHEYVKMAVKQYLNSEFELIKKYSNNTVLHTAKVIPYAYISRKLMAAAPFRLDRMGATHAIKKVIQNLLDSGYLKEMDKASMSAQYKTSQKAYMVADASWIWG